MANINASIKKPTKNAERPLFPAWCLAEGVINATEEDLEIAATACERWTWGCGGILFFGLSIEVVVAAIHPPYDSFLGTWASVIADCFVTIGVGGEIMFAFMGFRRQEELGKRAKKEVAALNKLSGEANERAAKAQLELERLKAPRGLSESQGASISAKLSVFGGHEVLIIASPMTHEGASFADQLHCVLKSASLKSQYMERWPIVGPTLIAEDVCIAFSDGDETNALLANTIAEALKAEGIRADTSAAAVDWWPAMSGKALVVIGTKT